jgi:hypothetical protein
VCREQTARHHGRACGSAAAAVALGIVLLLTAAITATANTFHISKPMQYRLTVRIY